MTAARDVLKVNRDVLGGVKGTVAVFKAYLDESGTHEGSPVVTVAAYMARPKQWAAFTSAFRWAIRPVKVYHATDAANCWGEFKGWAKADVAALAAKVIPIITRHTEMGIAIGIQMEHYEDALSDKPELRKLLGSPYSACLHWVMATILGKKIEHGNREQIAFFHEVNDYSGEAMEVFGHMERNYPTGRMTFGFGSKEKYVPLQAADILAYEANKRIRDSKRPDRKALEVLHAKPGRLSLKCYDKENLGWLVERLSAVYRAEHGLDSLRATLPDGG